MMSKYTVLTRTLRQTASECPKKFILLWQFTFALTEPCYTYSFFLLLQQAVISTQPKQIQVVIAEHIT